MDPRMGNLSFSMGPRRGHQYSKRETAGGPGQWAPVARESRSRTGAGRAGLPRLLSREHTPPRSEAPGPTTAPAGVTVCLSRPHLTLKTSSSCALPPVQRDLSLSERLAMSWELPAPSFIQSAWEESMIPPFWRGKLRPREAREPETPSAGGAKP